MQGMKFDRCTTRARRIKANRLASSLTTRRPTRSLVEHQRKNGSRQSYWSTEVVELHSRSGYGYGQSEATPPSPWIWQGADPTKQRLPDGGPGQGHDMKFETIGQTETEQWTYHAVANVIRAHSLIRSFPEVDPARTAITGISWGGYLTCIVAGLDNRFQAAVPVYGCGFLHENSAWLGDFAKMSQAHQAKWVNLWEPSRYVGSAEMPMLFVNGGNDGAYPPDSHAKTFALVHSPKYLHFVPELPHGHLFDRPKAIEVFVEPANQQRTTTCSDFRSADRR